MLVSRGRKLLSNRRRLLQNKALLRRCYAEKNVKVDFSKDYYGILGVKHEDDISVIKAAYSEKAKIYHPDKNPGHETEFTEAHNAWSVLKDSELKRSYDVAKGIVPKNFYEKFKDKDTIHNKHTGRYYKSNKDRLSEGSGSIRSLKLYVFLLFYLSFMTGNIILIPWRNGVTENHP
eukprot:TRINITY_DN4076_c1_g1_i1.p1 TRINITY_DN4076_c1_g1~~TRINITY_DN4076_c1_g1_i1.p1  ORF type:complete len:176 (-),score=27.17 TRINITY_DN4076_c1_g1_i1:56-583(-)